MIYLHNIGEYRNYGLTEALHSLGISYREADELSDEKGLIITEDENLISNNENIILTLKTDELFEPQIYLEHLKNSRVEEIVERFPSQKVRERDDNCEISELVEKSEDGFVINLDIFGEIAFHLARVEEFSGCRRDKYGRFISEDSIIHKMNCMLDPPVDMLIDLFKEILDYVGKETATPIPYIKRWKEGKRFVVVPTIDLDNLRRYPRLAGILSPFYNLAKFKLRDFFRSMDALRGTLITDNIAGYGIENIADIFDHSFTLYLGGLLKDKHIMGPDYRLNEPKLYQIGQFIRERDIDVGIHPDFKASCDIDLLNEQRDNLEVFLGRPIKSVRFHYLRIFMEGTPGMLSESGFTSESSLAYGETPGFRAGISTPFYLTDINGHNRTDVLEIPPVFMDASFNIRNSEQFSDTVNIVNKILQILVRYEGLGTFIFHYRHLTFLDYRYIQEIAKILTDEVKSRGGGLSTVGEVERWWRERMESCVDLIEDDGIYRLKSECLSDIVDGGVLGFLGLNDEGISVKTHETQLLKQGDEIRISDIGEVI